MKKYKLIFVFILVLVVAVFFRKSFSFRIKETDKYIEVSTGIMPDEYVLNAELSKCSSGEVSWNELSDSVTLKSSSPSKCYLYMDKSIEEEYYTSLALAVEAINNNTESTFNSPKNGVVSVNRKSGKIKLLKDIILKEDIQILKDTFINLNGHTLKFSNSLNNDAFIKVSSGVTLELYGEKYKSRIEYTSNTSNSIFSLSDNSILKINGGNFLIEYRGENLYSIISDNREKTSSIYISDTSFDVNGNNIFLLNSTKPVSISILDSELSIKGRNLSLISTLSKESNVYMDSINLVYDEQVSNTAQMINVPLGRLEIKNSNMVLTDESKENNNPKIIASNLLLDNSSITCKANSIASIIEIIDSGLIKNMNITCTGENIYNGIKYSGNGKLIIDSSMFELYGESTGIFLNNGDVTLNDTIINAKNQIQKAYK